MDRIFSALFITDIRTTGYLSSDIIGRIIGYISSIKPENYTSNKKIKQSVWFQNFLMRIDRSLITKVQMFPIAHVQF